MIFIQRRYAFARLLLIAVHKAPTNKCLSISICRGLSTYGDKRSTYGLKIIRYFQKPKIWYTSLSWKRGCRINLCDSPIPFLL